MVKKKQIFNRAAQLFRMLVFIRRVSVCDRLSYASLEPGLSAELQSLLDQRLAALDADAGNILSCDEIKAFVTRP